MTDEIRVFENFVSIPGIVRVRWQSDDPEQVIPSEDLFSVQLDKGLPANFGKKDKISTVQGIFYCHMCECEIKSIVTLRDHCKGTQHKRKECVERAKFYREVDKKYGGPPAGRGAVKEEQVKRESLGPGEVGDPSVGSADRKEIDRHVFEGRGGCREELGAILKRYDVPVVGINYLLEVRANDNTPPMYVCGLRSCKEFSAVASVMFDHLNELNHQQRYFREEYNSVPDSSEMREEVTAEFHNKGGIRELEKMRKEVHRGRHKRALLRKRDRAGGYSVMDLTGIRDPRDTAAAQVKEEERNGPDGSKGMESSGTEKRPRSRSRSPLRQQPSKQEREVPMPAAVMPPSQGLPSSSVTFGSDYVASPPSLASPSPSPLSFASPLSGLTTTSSTEGGGDPSEAAERKFNGQMAKNVMKVLDKYFHPNEKFDRKIATKEEYISTARELSHRFRRVEKESHLHNGGTMDTIKVTGDMFDRIQLQIDGMFENRPKV